MKNTKEVGLALKIKPWVGGRQVRIDIYNKLLAGGSLTLLDIQEMRESMAESRNPPWGRSDYAQAEWEHDWLRAWKKLSIVLWKLEQELS